MGGNEPEDQEASGALAALTTLLRETHLAPPDLLPSAVQDAARYLGAQTTVYLADYSQSVLVPMPVGPETAPVLPIDSTLAGRAYRMLTVQSAEAAEEPHLWMPIIDGVERLGVLKLVVRDPADLTDPAFQKRCWWFTHYLGHMISIVDAFGDAVDKVRRQRPRSVSAELIWQLLPPLTAGTDKVLVSGKLEPSSTVGGDVFDYALSDDTARFAILDATGHDLRSGLAAATALAAYRNSRRQGRGLFDQTEAIHRAVRDEFAGRMYASGIVGQLDLRSGLLQYLSAGHPPPLLLRGGKVVKTLSGGHRPLLGLDTGSVEIAEESLEPGDVIALYTDGVTEARDPEQQFFGIDRLVDFLEREAAQGTPLPETVRRVCRRIMEYQNGVLQDDATVLLLHWTTTGQELLDPTI
ncbi:PP2C family protein-serine/threonine phosphatase [Cellulomonas fengjieae]|uniref:Serine/threonine-protein phosphatase n=1 Tax=Cellulomonas fengjieae TaxID=2819978 RepID=A0ABS3SLE2_9CELL|nr:PP2C family protein-serine/threonine phosphatase [Cellulomonas fengjieae]MBO3085791.1 serine/threonine-protein phosphatase [Cellulomonas fengjieae]